MPKAILAIRTYPATLMLAILLFLATFIITTGSLGKVLSGGDGGDGGSGMGGTGKSGEFGGSGFGGTGGPSPFFTSTDSEEQKKTPEFKIPGLEKPSAPAIAQDSQGEVINSPITISNRVIEAIDSNPLVEETRIEIAQGEKTNGNAQELAAQTDQALQLVELQRVTEQPVMDALQRPQSRDLEVDSAQESSKSESQIATADLNMDSESNNSTVQHQNDQQLAEAITVKLETEQQASDQTRDRDGLPERIQRPDLPPFQRIRPIERPSLIPSRVQPMRI